MASDESRPACWVISDGAAGNERQALALAGALSLQSRVIRLRTKHPWDWFAPRVALGAALGMRDEAGHSIGPPWPAVAIGCGRQAALLTRCLRRWSAGRCFTVQILDPRIPAQRFDVVVAPRHDRLRGDNVIETLGALNAIDDAWIAAGRARFAGFAELPAPRTAVLVGASHRAQALDDAYFDALLRSLATLHGRVGGSFLVSTSRRTPAGRSARLREAFARWPGIFWAGPEDGENPYPGILAWADRLIVSADSVNMVSEACASGKPVHAFATHPVAGKLGAFHDALSRAGHLTALEADPPACPPPLRELAGVAAGIRRLMAGRGLQAPPADPR